MTIGHASLARGVVRVRDGSKRVGEPGKGGVAVRAQVNKSAGRSRVSISSVSRAQVGEGAASRCR